MSNAQRGGDVDCRLLRRSIKMREIDRDEGREIERERGVLVFYLLVIEREDNIN